INFRFVPIHGRDVRVGIFLLGPDEPLRYEMPDLRVGKGAHRFGSQLPTKDCPLPIELYPFEPSPLLGFPQIASAQRFSYLSFSDQQPERIGDPYTKAIDAIPQLQIWLSTCHCCPALCTTIGRESPSYQIDVIDQVLGSRWWSRGGSN